MNLLIVDPNPIFIYGLTTVIQNIPELCVREIVHTPEDALEKLSTLEVDLLVWGLGITDVAYARHLDTLKQQMPTLKVLVFDEHYGAYTVKLAAQCSVDGLLPRNIALSDLLDALNAIYEGRIWLRKTDWVYLKNDDDDDDDDDDDVKISESQKQLLLRIAQGYSSAQIAALLGVKLKTVERQIERLMRKLNVQSRAHAVYTAIQKGLID